jgi:beta-galactosidase
MMMRTFLLIAALFFSLVIYARRDTISINQNWKFTPDKNGVGFTETWYSSELVQGRPVQLPHTWNVEEENQHHYGWGWYQKKYHIPKEWKKKNVLIQFGAINHTALIYINGKLVAENRGDGFNKIFVTLNEHLHFGKDNIITVAVNNDYGKNKVPFGSSFDWPNDGGLIRPLALIVSDRPSARFIHVTPTLNLADKKGHLKIRLGMADKITWGIQLKISIREENQTGNREVYHKILAPVWKNDEALVDLILRDIHPWHFDFPNLYRIDVSVLKDSRESDRISAISGFRDFRFEGGQSFLNGEPVKLMGVELTAGSNPDLGLAEPDTAIIRIARLMKDVNTIFTRQHFQQSDVFYDFCDRNGILVQQEIPMWGPETPANDTISRIAMDQLKTMIHNLYNHPSIFSWGVGNELRARDADMKHLVGKLLEQSRTLDPSRMTSYVSNTLTRGFYNHPGFIPDAAAGGDFLMMNEYGGSWWNIPSGKIGFYLDSVHLSYPDLPFFISEFGLCEPNFKGGDERRIEDMIYHMSIYESKTYVQGAIYFDLTDYRTHYPGTSEKGRFRRRIHGVYDMYGSPKPSMKVLRELSSPLEVQGLQQQKGGKLSVMIMGSIGLPQHTVKGYKLFLSSKENDYSRSKSYPLPDIKPGETINLVIDDLYDGKGFITVERPSGFVVIQKSFY